MPGGGYFRLDEVEGLDLQSKETEWLPIGGQLCCWWVVIYL